MKKIFCFCFFLLFFETFHAQSWLWASTSNTISGTEGYGMARDPSGNVIITGMFTSSTIAFGTSTLTNSGNISSYIVKYDSNGNVLWARTQLSGANVCEARSVCSDPAGNIFVAGCFYSPTCFQVGTQTLISGGAHDVFVVKYDATGNVLWAVKAGGSATDEGYSITADAAGNSYVCGLATSSIVSMGTFTLAGSNGNNDHFFAKIDPTGNVQWLTKGIGSGLSWGYGTSADVNGNVYFTGLYTGSISFGSATLTSTGSGDMFLVKYTTAGSVIWAVSAGGPGGHDYGISVSTDPSGDPYVCGHYNSSTLTIGTFTFNNGGQQDAYLAKFNSAGICQWARTMNGPLINYGWFVNAYNNGVWMSGGAAVPTLTIGSISFSGLTGADNMFIANYDNLGNLNYATVINGGGDEENCVVGSSACLAYASGDYGSNPFMLGNLSLYRQSSGEPAWIAKLQITGSVIPNNAGICAGQTATLSVSGATTYSWSTGSFAPTPTVQPLNTTIYSFTGNTACGVATASVTVTVDPVPTLVVTPSSTVCSGSSVTLFAGGAPSISWSGGITNGVAFVPASSSVYTVTGVAGACAVTSTTSVQVFQIPVLTVTAPSSVCANTSATLSVTGASSYTWMPLNLASASIVISPASTTTLSVTGSNGSCQSTSNTTLVVKQGPSLLVVAGPTLVCTGQPAFLTASGASSYTWTGFAQGGTVLITPQSTMVYTVTAVDPLNPCVATGTALVKVMDCSAIAELQSTGELLLIPNPGEGTFTIENEIAKEGMIYVLNSAGQLVRQEKLKRRKDQVQLDVAPGIYNVVFKGTDGSVKSKKLIVNAK
jgi:hypothetical protein